MASAIRINKVAAAKYQELTGDEMSPEVYIDLLTYVHEVSSFTVLWALAPPEEVERWVREYLSEGAGL